MKFVFVGVIRLEDIQILGGEADAESRDIPSQCRTRFTSARWPFVTRKWKSSCNGTRFTFSNKRCKVSSERSLLMHLLRNILLSADHLDKKFLAPQRIHSTIQISKGLIAFRLFISYWNFVFVERKYPDARKVFWLEKPNIHTCCCVSSALTRSVPKTLCPTC